MTENEIAKIIVDTAYQIHKGWHHARGKRS